MPPHRNNRNRVFGWTPSESVSSVDRHLIAFDPSSPRYTRSISSPSLISSSELSSSSFYERSTSVETTESRATKKGDPEWAPRPRNAFIIYRCEFTRENSRDGPKGRNQPHTDKSLSKRAGEAWRRLSVEERNRYQEMAEDEKKRHAELYPDYRFRPARKTGSSKGSKSRRARSSASMPYVKRCKKSVEPSEHDLFDSNALSDRSAVDDSPHLSRSYSLPSIQETSSLLSASSTLVDTWSRSSISSEGSISSDCSPILFNAYDYAGSPSSEAPPPLSRLGSHTPCSDYIHTPTPKYVVSPITAISSSLAGWNGEQPASQQPISSSMAHWPSEAYASPSAHYNYTVWHPTQVTDTGCSMEQTGYWHGAYPDDASYHAQEARTQALQDYNAGLMTEGITERDCMLFHPSIGDQILFDGFCH